MTPINKEVLAKVRSSLFELHREFLVVLKTQRETDLHQPIGVTEWLQLIITAPEYEWLKPLNSLVTDVDALFDLESIEPEDITVVKNALNELFFKDDTKVEDGGGFFGSYRKWVLQNPELMLPHGRLKADTSALSTSGLAVMDAKRVRESWHERSFKQRRP